jgi:hypothetical protein
MTRKNDVHAQLESLWKTQQDIIQRLEKIEQHFNSAQLPPLTFPATEIIPPDPITQGILDRTKDARARRWKKIFGGFDADSFLEFKVLPACEVLFPQRGIEVQESRQNVRREQWGLYFSVNLLLGNDSQMIAVCVEKIVKIEYVDNLVENLPNFRRLFPEYQHQKLYGAIAAMDIEEGADKYAYRQGLFVLAQSGETVSILNNAQFQPKNW